MTSQKVGDLVCFPVLAPIAHEEVRLGGDESRTQRLSA